MSIFLKLLITSILFRLSSQQQDLSFTYTGFHHTNISLNGVALVDKHGVIHLTNVSSKVQGHAFYPSPINFKNSTNGPVSSFSTCFAFCIHPEYPKLGGHGLAFTISPSTELNSPLPSQYLGLLNSHDIGNFSNHLFAVEFDTVQDFEFQDIDGNHVGIDINSMDSNASASAAYFTDDSTQSVNLTLKSGKPILAWIEYDSVTNVINVTISPSSEKPKRPLLSYKIDLSPILLDSMYIGFSASTGLLASSHYVSGWSFRLDGEAQSLDLGSLPLIPGTKRIIHKKLIVSLSVFAFFVLLALIISSVYTVRRVKNAETIEDWEIEVGPQRYKYLELKQATQNFKDSELLGIGGFGKVYKGTIPSTKMSFAVKRISHESKQGVREFVSEISTIGRLRHRNLVQLLGWCRRGVDLLLVYEFMPNGSLDKFLFDELKCVLNWDQRFRIIKGVASGLLYLHEGYEQVVIHRDVKASNVLLDSEMNGKLGDFGLAKLYHHGSNPGTTRVVGTFGYLAPEMPRTGRATTRSDVFAFGTLLLEVACGRRPIELKTGPDDLVLLDYVWAKYKDGRLLDVVDVRMVDFDENEVTMVLKLGLLCSSYQHLARPSMRQVVSYLEGEADLPPVSRPCWGNEVGFEDFTHPYESASFGGTSSSFTDLRNGNTDRSFPSYFTSPNSILHSMDEPR